MKNISKLGFLLVGFILSLTSCRKDETRTILNSDVKLETSISENNLILQSEKAMENVLSISWKIKNTQVSLAPSYTVSFRNGENLITLSADKSPLELTTEQLNTISTNLKLEPEQPTDIQIEVISALSEFFKITSNPLILSVSIYKETIDLSTEWGVVGTINNWGSSPDIPFWKSTEDDNHYVAYINVEMDGGEIKFRKNQDWVENLGDNETDNSLESGGANIKINKGSYRILWDIINNSYIYEKYTWGIIGSAGKGWGDNDDIPLSYNGVDNIWEAKGIELKDGEIKIRFNNSWDLNYGGNDGILEKGGNNIKVTAGTYDVIVDFSEDIPKYKIIQQ